MEGAGGSHRPRHPRQSEHLGVKSHAANPPEGALSIFPKPDRKGVTAKSKEKAEGPNYSFSL